MDRFKARFLIATAGRLLPPKNQNVSVFHLTLAGGNWRFDQQPLGIAFPALKRLSGRQGSNRIPFLVAETG